MDKDYYKKYEPIFNSWHIKEMLGEGSFGKVYSIERQDSFITQKAALKVITIPQSQSEVKSIMAEADGMDESSAMSYFHQVVEDIVSEFVLMSKLKGNSNIVNYEDHIVEEHKEDIGWDILIRMELLTPLIDHIRATKLARKDIIKLGIDMCKALELCQKYNIIHRDIKPENIFISENGDYKLGDFGIARTIEKTTGGLSKKGTYVYMAPEIYRGEAYGSSIDLYSLGIVMYRLLNENRTPFLPAYPAPITHNDRESAVLKRISGSIIPKPFNADGRLAEIVLKACAYKPKDRYSSPMQMREELEAILYNKEEARIIYPKGDATPIKSIEYIETGAETPELDKVDKTDSFLEASKGDDYTGGKTVSDFDEKHEDYTINKTISDIAEYEKEEPVKKTTLGKRSFFAWGLCAIILAGVVAGVLMLHNGGNDAVQIPNYDLVGEYEDGLAIVIKGDKYGFIDEDGNEVVPIIYDEAKAYVNGIAEVVMNGESFKIDKDGNRIAENVETPPVQEATVSHVTNTNQGAVNTEPIPSTSDSASNNNSNSNSTVRQQPFQPAQESTVQEQPPAQQAPPKQNDPPPNNNKPPEIYVDFD